LDELINHLQWRRGKVVVVGHSMGVNVILQMVQLHGLQGTRHCLA